MNQASVSPQMNKPTVLDGLVEQVRGRVHDYFPDVRRIGRVRVTHSIHRSYSSIYWVAIYADGQPRKQVIIKISETAAAQYLAMKAIWPRFEAHPTWKIPRPLDYWPRDAALVMEEVSATPLLERFPWVFWHENSCQSAELDCRRAGQWLRFYHDIEREDDWAPLNAAGQWPGVDETLNELANAGFEQSICPVMDHWFVPLVKQIVTKPRPVATVHGDFKTDNVMMDNECVVVIDLAAERRNAIDLDIAAFLNSLLMLRLTRPIPSATMDRMRQAFLKGYFGTEECAMAVICFLQGIGLADIALEIVQRRPSNLVHAWVERTVGAALESIVDELRSLS
jgi:hypothetical protein